MDQTGLVERASQGDHEAFGALIGAHLARLDTAARLILRDPELARDAVQEATLRAWKNLRGLRDPDRFEAWLHRLTVNACLDLARRRRGRVIEVELTPLVDAPIPDATSRVADALYVERMLAAVDPAQRAVVGALLPRPLVARDGRRAGHSGGDGEVAPQPRARRDAHQGRR